MKKNNVLKIIIIIIIVLIIIIGGITLINNYQNKEEPLNKNKRFIEIEAKDKYNRKFDYDKPYKVYSDYDEFNEDFNSDLKKIDFYNNNYLVIEVNYNPCSEEEITPTEIEIDGNKINILIKYKSVCGGCAPDYLYYAIKLDKKIVNPKVNIDSKAINNPECDPNVSYKPMIYLYPEEKAEVEVILKNKKLLTTTYPKYKDGWKVIANPDGTLVDEISGREYYGLYWEGKNYTKINMTKGFVVKGEDSIKFLEEKLNELGLTDKESEEFIVYWLPKLEKNKYNYIYFAQTEEVNKYMPLEVNPKPDTVIRILMYYKPLDKKINVKEQKIKQTQRHGFMLVEWGGTLLK